MTENLISDLEFPEHQVALSWETPASLPSSHLFSFVLLLSLLETAYQDKQTSGATVWMAFHPEPGLGWWPKKIKLIATSRFQSRWYGSPLRSGNVVSEKGWFARGCRLFNTTHTHQAWRFSGCLHCCSATYVVGMDSLSAPSANVH